MFIPKDSYSIVNSAKGQSFRYDPLKYVHVDRRAEAGIVGGGIILLAFYHLSHSIQ
jgi:hypothetical protein